MPGLREAFVGAGLSSYGAAAEAWCCENGCQVHAPHDKATEPQASKKGHIALCTHADSCNGLLDLVAFAFCFSYI